MTKRFRVLRTGHHNIVKMAATAMFVTLGDYSASAQFIKRQEATPLWTMDWDYENRTTWCSDSTGNPKAIGCTTDDWVSPAHTVAAHLPELFMGLADDAAGANSHAPHVDLLSAKFSSMGPTRSNSSANLHDSAEDKRIHWSDVEGLDSVSVCCRPIVTYFPMRVLHHCYIQIREAADGMDHTWGILRDADGSKNQIPRKDDGAILDSKGKVKLQRNSGGKCSPVAGGDGQIKKLKEGLQAAVNSETCPSCGKKYKLWIVRDVLHIFDGHNSNTWVYNMLLGAGMKPPRESAVPGYHRAAGAWYPAQP